MMSQASRVGNHGTSQEVAEGLAIADLNTEAAASH
jgi:hypothetical protein